MPASATAGATEAQQRLDADAELGARRLERFIAAMIPIAFAFEALYLVAAIRLPSVALAGGAVAVAIYIAALLWARRELRRHRIARAALCTGLALLVMVAIGAVFVHFELAALVLIAIAAVVVVLPHIERKALVWFAALTLGVLLEIVILDGVMTPLVTQPPLWFQHVVIVAAVIAAASLIMIMLSADHERMRDLVKAAQISAAEAHRARAATETFLVAAAHQLRTPVSTVLLQSETVLGTVEGDARTRVRLERLVRQAKRLQHVVDAMLDVSRASAGTLTLDRQRIDLAGIVRDVATRHARAAEDAGATVTVHAPSTLPFDGDPQRLALAVSNLIDNAIKFGAGTPVEIAVRDHGAEVEVIVSDSGPGLTATERELCFEREVKLSSRADGGLGVGLWLVRKLAHAMKGEVTAEDRGGSGSRFVVRIPRSQA